MITARGDIVFTNARKGGLLSWAIRFFSRSSVTHSAVGIGSVMGMSSILEANMNITVTPWKNYLNDPTQELYIFRPKGIAREVTDAYVADLYRRFGAKSYGFFQLFWFIWRWANEMFGRNVKKQRNWFPNGDICSEVTYWAMLYAAWAVNNVRLIERLEEWTDNTVHPGDLMKVCREFPDEFELVMVRK